MRSEGVGPWVEDTRRELGFREDRWEWVVIEIGALVEVLVRQLGLWTLVTLSLTTIKICDIFQR